MSLRRVRCPHCARRYDVTGVAAGTLLGCVGCTAILSVPAAPVSKPRLPLLRIAGGVTAGLVTVAALAMALRPSSPGTPASPLPSAAAPSSGSAGSGGDPGFVDDPVARLKQELRLEFPASRFSFSQQPRPYFIALESSERFVGGGGIDEFAQGLELASTVFRREIAERLGLRPVKDTLLPVLILGSRESFDRYCDRVNHRRYAPEVKGFYEYSRLRIVTYQDDVLPRDVLLHEGTHQMVHYYVRRESQGRKAAVTFWLQEGLGCFFEPYHRRVDGEVGPDLRLDRQRLPMLKQVLSRPDRAEFVPLPRLVGMTVDAVFDAYGAGKAEDSGDAVREAKFCYAESWALVHFLRGSGPRHRKVFEEYLRRELAGTASKQVFEQLVHSELGLDLYQLEDEFVKYIQGLR